MILMCFACWLMLDLEGDEIHNGIVEHVCEDDFRHGASDCWCDDDSGGKDEAWMLTVTMMMMRITYTHICAALSSVILFQIPAYIEAFHSRPDARRTSQELGRHWLVDRISNPFPLKSNGRGGGPPPQQKLGKCLLLLGGIFRGRALAPALAPALAFAPASAVSVARAPALAVAPAFAPALALTPALAFALLLLMLPLLLLLLL